MHGQNNMPSQNFEEILDKKIHKNIYFRFRLFFRLIVTDVDNN